MSILTTAAFLDGLTSSACAVASWGGVWIGAHRLALRYFGRDQLSVRYIATSLISTAFVVSVLQVLGLIGWLTPGAVCIVCLAFAFVGCWFGSANSGRDLEQFAHWVRHRIRDGYGILFCIAGILFFQAMARGLRCPPLSHDSLTYHAFLPAHWIQAGGLVPFAAPGGMDGYRAFPMHFELLAAFFSLPFGNDLVLNLVNLPVLILAALTAYELARELGATASVAIWCPVLFCFSSPVWGLATTQYNDILLATMMGIAVLFLIRHLRTNSTLSLVVCAGALGLACGVKYSAVVFAAGILAITAMRILLIRDLRTRLGLTLLSCIGVGVLLGGYSYIRNWAMLDNPLYPFEVKVADWIIFDGSPMQSQILANTPRGDRADDWRVLQLMFSRGKIVWGPVFAIVLPLALWGGVRPGENRRGRLLACLLFLGFLAAYFVPDDGIAERTRRMFSGSSLRLLGFGMLTATALATSAASQIRWPAGFVGIVPTFVLISHAMQGSFPQPPSYAEAIAIIVGVTLMLWLTCSDRGIERALLIIKNRTLRTGAVAALVLLGSVLTPLLIEKRNAARYLHYAESYDYHAIDRNWITASKTCDEPEQAHIIALAHSRSGHDEKSAYGSALTWFFYPLLGSNWQNRVVYASVHETGDIPCRDHRGGVSTSYDYEAWLQNLHRLHVDRLVVAVGTYPESEWISRFPATFRPVASDSSYAVFAIDQGDLALLLDETNYAGIEFHASRGGEEP